jgi:DNA topoisomerase-2
MDVDEDEGPSPTPEEFRDLEKGKTIEQIYQKKTQLEHILLRPDTYIGSTERNEQKQWVYNEEEKKMEFKTIEISPGFYKIFDEILVNAADNRQRDPSMKNIKVTIDPENNLISVHNDGKGIPIQLHQKEKVYVPELIFGHLLTSSNYNDDDKKVTGGRNGYGAKLCNIFSTEFIVETASKESEQKYYQKFTNNMSVLNPPKILKNSRKEEYTRISFKPDLEKFGMEKLDEDAVSLLKRRVYDLAGCVKNVNVYLNGSRIAIKNFKEYVEMYLPKGEDGNPIKVLHDKSNERWEVIVCKSEDEFQHISFVNSIATPKGGTHLNHVAEQMVSVIRDAIDDNKKKVKTKSLYIKNQLMLFVNCLIENPSFDSQTKENMTLPPGNFGSKYEMGDAFRKNLKKSEIVVNVKNFLDSKEAGKASTTDGKKSRSITGIPNLMDAINAGTAKSKECTLILTEGNSAKNLVLSGFAVIGRDNYGVYPLRGKILNVRDASAKQVNDNRELSDLKKILGLKTGTNYTEISQLRYGHIMIMTDQDHDGSHIKGLIINYFDHFFPSLLKIPGFLKQFITPIVKVKKGKKTEVFFNLPEYESWKDENPDSTKWDPKYYKGLATSTKQEAREYFSDLPTHQKDFASIQEEERAYIKLAFSKDKAEARKQWLRGYKPGTYLDTSVDEIRHSDFINNELILFSMADNIRSIPSVVDSFKPGQRKILYGCFKYGLKNSIKVEQLGGYISLHTAYHHGETSLHSTIIGMANDYVGNCNINLLFPEGQFGSRMQGGKDAGAARYLSTKLQNITRAIYHIHDDSILKQQEEENKKIEPEYYVPVMPMILANGAEGIGTGWSTFIPNYNPKDIIDNLRRRMKAEQLVPMAPWYRGFKGNIIQVEPQKFRCEGLIEKVNETTVRITELPIRTWTENYKKQLEKWMNPEKKTVEKSTAQDKNQPEKSKNQDKKLFNSMIDYCGNASIEYILTLSETQMKEAEKEGLLERFGLVSTINTSNMVCFDGETRIKKYNTPEEILEEFYEIRLKYYIERKKHLSNSLKRDFDKISEKVRFILEVVKGSLKVTNRKKKEIIKDLKDKEYIPFPPLNNSSSQNGNEEEDPIESIKDYDYLLNMPIYSLTKEKVERLLKDKEEAQKELEILLSRTPHDLWEIDLKNVEDEWNNVLELHKIEEEAGIVGSNKGKKRGKGSAAARQRKHDDDDFAPKSVARKRNTTGNTATNTSASQSAASSTKASAGTSQRKITDMFTKKPESPNEIFEIESDKETDDIIKLVNTSAEKGSPTKRIKVEDELAEETGNITNPFEGGIFSFEGFDSLPTSPSTSTQPTKKAQTSKASTSSKSKSSSAKSKPTIEDSDDDNFQESAATKPKVPVKRTVPNSRVSKPKPTVISSDEVSEGEDKQGSSPIQPRSSLPRRGAAANKTYTDNYDDDEDDDEEEDYNEIEDDDDDDEDDDEE